MPKKKIEEITEKTKRGKAVNAKPVAAIARRGKTAELAGRQPAAASAAIPEAESASEDLSQFPPVFENKAGHYELIRVDRGQAFYSFTNHDKKTVDATMSVVMWRKMQERAASALKETA